MCSSRCTAISLLAENLLSRRCARYATAFNFGPFDDDAHPVGWIADRMAALWGDGARWIHEADPSAHEANYLKLDASRARAELGWRPRLRLAQALEWLVDWYRAWQDGADLAAPHARADRRSTSRCPRVEQVS